MYICSREGVGRRVPSGVGRSLQSFTLVEVVIAIAIASFVLISILGMMSYAGQTVQQSDKNARLASVASQVLASVATKGFGSSPYGLYANNGSYTVANYVQTNYYTFEGLPTNAAAAYFQTTIADPNSSGSWPFMVNGQPVMEPIQIQILWPKPASGTAAFVNTNSIVTSVLNFESL